MARSEIDAICRSCKTRFRAAAKVNWLGMRVLKCPSCGADVDYPMNSVRRVVYWIVAVLMILLTLAALAVGRVSFPGMLGVLSIYALVVDARVRREVAAAEASPPPAPAS